MSNDPQFADEAQFIVVPRTRGSSSLLELRQIARSKGVEIARVLGPDEKPVRLIIRGSRIKIAELRELFSNDCIFEEDRRLRPA